MKIYRVIRQECTCYMAYNSHQIHDVEKMFLGRYRNIHMEKIIFDHIHEIPPNKGRDIICHAILHHPLSVRNICRQKRCEDKNIKTDIVLSSCRCV